MPREIAPRIVVDPNVRFGKPVVRGTRVTAELVVAKLAGGMSLQDVADEYGLTGEDVRAALSYAASVLAAEEVRATAWVATFLVDEDMPRSTAAALRQAGHQAMLRPVDRPIGR